MAYVSNNSGVEEWYTPQEYIEAARTVLGTIDLDPASNDVAQTIVNAITYFTIDDNGLEKPWTGSVWLNPPYSRNKIGNFVEKLVSEYTSGNISQAITLTNNATDTRWGQLLLANCTAICMFSGRIKFLNRELKPLRKPLQGQMACYFGTNAQLFKEAFSNFGTVFTNVS